MEKKEIQDAASPERLKDAARARLVQFKDRHPREHTDHSTSVREAAYKGHDIRIETTYRITIDGEPVRGHVVVGNNGRVHYHSIPNQDFVSAIDLAKRIIDLMPAEGAEE